MVRNNLGMNFLGKNCSSWVCKSILCSTRSGEEGFYPELIEFTEERLRKVNPKR